MFSTFYDKETKLWSGRAKLPLYNPQVSLGQVMLDSMCNYGSKIAQVLSQTDKIFSDFIKLKQFQTRNFLKKNESLKNALFPKISNFYRLTITMGFE